MGIEIDKSIFFSSEPDEKIRTVLGEIPGRWGRMTPLSRLIIFETGTVLVQQGLLKQGQRLNEIGKQVGLVGVTKRGSLQTDLAFIETMEEGYGLASPALFGYTLPNIPLAEAAVTFGITGPVYAIIDEGSSLEGAEREARLLLMMQQNLDFVLACAFDHYGDGDQQGDFSVTFTVLNQKC